MGFLETREKLRKKYGLDTEESVSNQKSSVPTAKASFDAVRKKYGLDQEEEKNEYGYDIEQIKSLQRAARIPVTGIWNDTTQSAYNAGYRPTNQVSSVGGAVSGQNQTAAVTGTTTDTGTEHLQAQKDYADKLNYDLESGQAELEQLKQARRNLVQKQGYFTKDELQSIKEYDKKIQELEVYINNVQRIQEGVKLAGVADESSDFYDPDFKSKSGYVSTKYDKFSLDSLFNNQYGMGYADLTYEYINGGQSGIREDIIRKGVAFNADSSIDTVQKWKTYDHMTEDEIAVYNYYYNKDGKDVAQKYLDSIQESLNQRVAAEQYGKLEGNTALELLYAPIAGLDQFDTGVKSLLNRKDTYIPATSTQMVSSKVRQDLADDGAKLPEWLGGASLGQGIYDFTTTMANMAPSILASTAIGIINPAAGTAVGNALMGASAAGNAYQQKLNLGYTQEQARSYGLMVGASEAALQYALGGIGKLGGKLTQTAIKNLNKLDTVFAKFAQSTGGKLLLNASSEAVEEGLQSVIEPYLWQAVTGEEASVDWAETLYSALMGFVSGGVFEGISEISSPTDTTQQSPTPGETDSSAALVMTEEGGAQSINGVNASSLTRNGTQRVLGDAVAADGVQGAISQAAQETAAEAKPGTLEWAQELAMLGADKQGVTTPQSAQGAASSPDKGSQGVQGVFENFEDILARGTNAAADPVGAALDGFKQTGTVTNKQATDILNNSKALQTLREQVGLELPDTAAGRRNAIKAAVEQLAQVQAESSIQTTTASEQSGAKEQIHRHQDDLNTLEPADVTTNAVSKPLNSYPAEKQRTIRSYIAAVDQKLKSFVQSVKSGDLSFKRQKISDVSDRAAKDIGKLLGVDVSGYTNNINTNGIQHIIDRHGRNGEHDSTMAIDDDIARIGWVLENYDTVELLTEKGEQVYSSEFRDSNNRPAPQIRFIKKIDGTHYVVEAVCENKYKKLWVQGTYLQKNEDVTQAPAEGQKTDHETNAQSDLASPSSTNSIPQTEPGVNTILESTAEGAESANPSVGAAPAGFDPNTHLQYQYGTLPEGENAVRSDDLPVSTDGNNRVSQTAVTVKGAKVTPDEFADLLTKDVTEKNGMTYIPITNDATVQKAMDHISNEGWEAAKAQWKADVHNGKAGADMSAVGALLLNNAAKAGDKTAWLDILHDYQILGTNTAQGMQALRILKKLSPSDKLYMAKRSIEQMVKDMKLDTDVTIDPELEAEYNEAETDEQRDAVLKKIQKNVAQQLPTTFIEKFTALRYVNMLGNLRTQGRNIVGNLTMKGTRAIHNTVAAGIEAVVNKVSGGKTGRTRSATVSKAQKAAAAKDFESLKDHILDGGKYNDNMTATGIARGVQEQKQIFKFKPLEGYRKVTNWAMEQGDIIFARAAYARALAGYLKANGITETDYSKVDTKIMDDARLFAAKEAQEATFRDTNWLSGWVSKIGRRKDTPAVVKLLSEGIMPFRKTPANVLVRAEEYSPLGVVNSVVLSVKAAQKGSDVTANQVINSWAKTLTGTGLFGMGMLLQSLGMLSAGPDEDEKKEGFEDLSGWQDYALTLPDGTNLTIDCFSPSAIPVLMGAQLMQLIGENGFQLKDLEAALTSMADPIVEMSMLQGVNDTLENVQYADSSLGQLAINAAVSYLTQGLTNTLAGQLERSFEDSRMQTYVDKDSDLPAWLQRTLGKASAKTPGLDYNQIPYINAWGEEEKNPPTGLNLVYNLLSPSYFDKGKDDELTRELNRLNEVQSDVNVYPSTPDKTVTINKQEYNLSADEYVAVAKLRGQTQKQIVESLIANSDYASLSDEDKAKAIGYAYDYARDHSLGDVIETHPGITNKWMQSISDDPADGIIRHIAADGKYTFLSVSDASYVDDLLAGLTPESGKTNVRDIQRIEAITGADSKLSADEQTKVLEDTLTDSAFAKYQLVLDLGMDNDDYASSYRTYLDEKAVGGKGTKARIIAQFREDLDVSKSVAEALYDIYAGVK